MKHWYTTVNMFMLTSMFFLQNFDSVGWTCLLLDIF